MLKNSVYLLHRNVGIGLKNQDMRHLHGLKHSCVFETWFEHAEFKYYSWVLPCGTSATTAFLFCNGVVPLKLLMTKQRLKNNPPDQLLKNCVYS